MAIATSPAEAPAPAPRPRARAGALDPRLLQTAHATRRYLVVSVAVGVLTALAVVSQAWLIADAVSGAFVRHRSLAELRGPVAVLLVVVVFRALLGWATERAAFRASARAKSQLRAALVERVGRLGPEGIERGRTGALAILATRGVDALDAYFARYLPQVFLSVIVPLAVLVVVAGADWISALIIAVTVPLIPLFMALIGAATRDRTARQVRTLQRLAGHFLDVVAGLPTLKVFGRAKAQSAVIREVTDRYRRTTMANLRLAFLSSLVLELLGTVSVALVAVAVGLRLLGGHLDFRTALFVLVLAPEAYLPLRLLGANYHASAEGMKVADEIFDVLALPVRTPGVRRDVPDPATVAVSVEDVVVRYPGRERPALDGVSLVIEPGEVLAVTGPSGCGKSTLVSVVLGMVVPDAGRVMVGDVDLAELDLDAWRARVAWVPQRPHLFSASVADNVRLGRPAAALDEVWQALADAGLEGVVRALPDGVDTRLGERGAGLSAGERQRVALARAFLRDAPLLLLDEPTAGLDTATEEGILQTMRAGLRDRTVLLVAHRPSLVAMADRVQSLA
ncbi:MAG TPA: thiol reductant ABC exporter subunit CydD [Acidimicrobiales bacterium]|nr:thiol reductant ABC exporter subunit CydD [Acidimicrobiales bacterium]